MKPSALILIWRPILDSLASAFVRMDVVSQWRPRITSTMPRIALSAVVS